MNRLENFPPMYYINLDHCVERNAHMQNIINTFQIEGTRISATNGADAHALVENIPDRLRPNELACAISHLRAIQYWLRHSDSDTAVICEDDVSFDTVQHWPFTWKDVSNALPYYWEICQCCIIYHPKQDIQLNLHQRKQHDYSAACYIIKRSYAERLMSHYWVNDKWKLDYPSAVPLTSEEAIYRPGSCLSIPLFTYANYESTIQTNTHVNTYHTFSKKIHELIWTQLPGSGVNILAMEPSIMYDV